MVDARHAPDAARRDERIVREQGLDAQTCGAGREHDLAGEGGGGAGEWGQGGKGEEGGLGQLRIETLP